MTKVLQSKFERLGADDALLGITDTSAPWKVNERRLTVEGKPVYELQLPSNTFSFLFRRVHVPRPRTIPPSILQQKLGDGLVGLDEEVTSAFSALLPEGDYLVSLLEVQPTLVMPGDASDYFAHESVALFGLEPPCYDLPGNPRTSYYRVGQTVFEPEGKKYGYHTGEPYQLRAGVFGFLAPMESIRALDPFTVDMYRDRASATPATAVALSVLDVRSPSVGMDGAEDPGPGGIHAHWCWSHFLLDGHHKVRAASLADRPLTLLSFTNLAGGISSTDQVKQLLQVLG